MNTKMSKLALAIGALVMAGGAMAQSTATTNSATANANVIAPITITNGQTLEFGNVVAGAGTVTIAANGTRTDSTTALTPGGQQGTVRAATFNVAGEGTSTYAITLPSTDVTLSDGAGTPHTMTVNAFKVAGTGVDSLLNTGVLAAGVATLNVGATLNVAALQAPGAYTGTYSVTVAYN